jgi:hypothetical protein
MVAMSCSIFAGMHGVGELVGFFVGEVVGFFVGEVVGLFVGELVGFFVGDVGSGPGLGSGFGIRVKTRQETYRAARLYGAKEKLPMSFRVKVAHWLRLRFKIRVRTRFLPTGTPSSHGTQFRYSSSWNYCR